MTIDEVKNAVDPAGERVSRTGTTLKLKPGQDFGRFKIELKERKPGQEYELVATTVPPLDEDFNHTEILLSRPI